MKKIGKSFTRLFVLLAAVLIIVFNTTVVNAEGESQDTDVTIVSAGEKDGEQTDGQNSEDQNKDGQKQDEQKQDEQKQEEQKQQEQKQEEQKQPEPQGKDQWMNSNGQWWYKLANGSWAVGWKQIDGKWYYFDNNGYMQTGWTAVANVWYYMNTAGDMATGWVNDKGTWYYMGKNGVLTTGWIQSGSKWYFMKSSGAMATRWAKDGSGDWYYFKDNGEMSVGWCHDGSNWYFMEKNGQMQTGWVKDEGKWYFLKSSGALAWDEWVSDKGYWYHVDKSGVMQTGQFTDKDGTVYDLGTSGAVADFTAQKAQQYSSNTNYLIMVDRTAHKVYIFQGRQGNWTTLKEFSCTDGVGTPNGTFQIGIHNYHFGEEKGYTCWYATQITGEILFHSVLYAKNSMTTITDGRLGIRASHGCIRLDINNAKYIYENIPQGTKVIIYE